MAPAAAEQRRDACCVAFDVPIADDFVLREVRDLVANRK
jgi:hypothetical protein